MAGDAPVKSVLDGANKETGTGRLEGDAGRDVEGVMLVEQVLLALDHGRGDEGARRGAGGGEERRGDHGVVVGRREKRLGW